LYLYPGAPDVVHGPQEKLIELIAQAPQIFERAVPEQRRELVGLLTSKRVLKGRTLEFELRKPFDALVSAANSENGWVNWSGLATRLADLAKATALSVQRLAGLATHPPDTTLRTSKIRMVL
jgi:hypothetical protein